MSLPQNTFKFDEEEVVVVLRDLVSSRIASRGAAGYNTTPEFPFDVLACWLAGWSVHIDPVGSRAWRPAAQHDPLSCLSELAG